MIIEGAYAPEEFNYGFFNLSTDTSQANLLPYDIFGSVNNDRVYFDNPDSTSSYEIILSDTNEENETIRTTHNELTDASGTRLSSLTYLWGGNSASTKTSLTTYHNVDGSYVSSSVTSYSSAFTFETTKDDEKIYFILFHKSSGANATVTLYKLDDNDNIVSGSGVDAYNVDAGFNLTVFSCATKGKYVLYGTKGAMYAYIRVKGVSGSTGDTTTGFLVDFISASDIATLVSLDNYSKVLFTYSIVGDPKNSYIVKFIRTSSAVTGYDYGTNAVGLALYTDSASIGSVSNNTPS